MNIDNPNNLPIPRQTLSDMVNTYVLAEQEITQAYGILCGARDRLKAAFNPDSYAFDLRSNGRHGERPDYDKPAETMKEVQREVWRVLVGRMELRRILSIKRAADLDRQLETGEGLPEITLPNILAMLEGTVNQASTYIEEAIQEVFQWLTPQRGDYKTNNRTEVGRKVIRYGLSHRWGGGFKISYHYRQNYTALDNVFHALDGKGTIAKSYQGPLCDAIYAAKDGKGETDYFKFKCFGNGNIHIEFKRLDLLAKFNAVAGVECG